MGGAAVIKCTYDLNVTRVVIVAVRYSEMCTGLHRDRLFVLLSLFAIQLQGLLEIVQGSLNHLLCLRT